MLWRQLRGHQLQEFKFKRQEPIGPYIADFVCYQTRLVIELDGGQHAEDQRDVQRDAWFRRNDFTVMRFWNDQVLNEMEAVLEAILRAQKKPSLPSPSPARGEGP